MKAENGLQYWFCFVFFYRFLVITDIKGEAVAWDGIKASEKRRFTKTSNKYILPYLIIMRKQPQKKSGRPFSASVLCCRLLLIFVTVAIKMHLRLSVVHWCFYLNFWHEMTSIFSISFVIFFGYFKSKVVSFSHFQFSHVTLLVILRCVANQPLKKRWLF